MIFLILACTLIGYLVGHALAGLCVGLAFFALYAWDDYTPTRMGAPRKHRKHHKRK